MSEQQRESFVSKRTEIGTCTRCGAVMPLIIWDTHREAHREEAIKIALPSSTTPANPTEEDR